MISHSTSSKPATAAGQGAEGDRELVLLVEAGDLDDELHGRAGPYRPSPSDRERVVDEGPELLAEGVDGELRGARFGLPRTSARARARRR